MNHIEAAILDRVAQLNPGAFRALDDFCAKHGDFLDKPIVDFDREIQFYIAYLEYAETFKRAGLKFCYPQVSDTRKEVCNRNGFDLALVGKLIKENSRVVCNDFALSGPERIFVVTGPNQGGKTTFARTFGQLHYLASFGLSGSRFGGAVYFFSTVFLHTSSGRRTSPDAARQVTGRSGQDSSHSRTGHAGQHCHHQRDFLLNECKRRGSAGHENHGAPVATGCVVHLRDVPG